MKVIKTHIFSSISLLLLLLFSTTGCDNYSGEIPEGLEQWYISAVTGDTTGTTGNAVLLDVYCPVAEDCNYITDFVTLTNDRTVKIKAYGALEEKTVCLTSPTVKVLSYEFKTRVKGQYSLQFISKDSSVVEHRVLIE